MRKLTVRRKWSIVGCALKIKLFVIISDKATDCGKLKNGKEISLDIPDTAVTVELSAFCGASLFTIPAGTCDVYLTAKPIMNPSDPFIITKAPNCDRNDKTIGSIRGNCDGDLLPKSDRIISDIREYMIENEDCGYTSEHVNKLENILSEYLAKLKNLSVKDDNEIKSIVRDAVLEINKLGEAVDHCIIETDEREDICMLINEAAIAAGYSITEDITEEWREW